jgi:hypothetical protein
MILIMNGAQTNIISKTFKIAKSMTTNSKLKEIIKFGVKIEN